MKYNPVCIIGVDGTGKTTQAKLLIHKLTQENCIAEYRWVRFHHLFSLPLLFIARFLKLSEVQKIDENSEIGYHYFERSKIISFLYPYLLYIDTLIDVFLKIYIPILSGKLLVCDRFIYDTLVDVMVSTKNYDFLNSKLCTMYINLIPKNAIVLMLATEESILKGRRVDVFCDKTLPLRIKLYKQVSEYFSIPFIDASLNIDEIHEQILVHIESN